MYCTVHAYETIAFVPSGNDVDSSVQVVGVLVRLRIWHSVVAPGPRPGSSRRKLAAVPVPLCVTVTVWPAIVTGPVRGEPELAATASVTVPVPVPLAPDAIVMKGALLVAVHAQALSDVTVTVGDPPPPATLRSVVDSV